MSNQKEDEQLLADASTLLMFATAAARQNSPSLASLNPEDSASKAPNPEPSSDYSRSEPPLLPHNSAVPSSSFSLSNPPFATFPPKSHAPANSPSLPSRNASDFSHRSLPPLRTLPKVEAEQARSPQSATSSLGDPSNHLHQNTKVNGQNVFGRDSNFLNPAYAHPPSQVSETHPSSHVPSHPSSHAPSYPATLVTSPRTLEQLPPSFGGSGQSFKQNILKSPTSSNTRVTYQYRNISPKPALAPSNPTQHLNLSPRFAMAPTPGSFQHTHKRTVSEGNTIRKSLSPPSLLPGPASVTLSRAVNTDSGQRTSDGQIAAAALAAAADIPFPLKNRAVSPFEQHQSTSAQVQNPTTVKSEPDPEIDVNKTDSEPDSDANEDRQSVTDGIPKRDQNQEALATLVNEPLHPKEEHTSDGIPPLASYKVKPDAGTIGCICGIEEDDGFTIQCDVCFRWQHCLCMGYKTNEEVPEDEYKCYYCDEHKWNKFDPRACKAETSARLELDGDTEPQTEPQNEPIPPKRKTLASGKEEKKRRKSEKENKRPAERPPTEKRKLSGSGGSITSPNSSAIITVEINNKNNPLLEDGVTAETYQSVYYRLTENDYKTPLVKEQLIEYGNLFEKTAHKSDLIEVMTLARFKQLKLSQLDLPNHQKYVQERNELRRNVSFNKTRIKVRAYSENPKQKFVGISKMGLFITDPSAQSGTVIPAGTMVIEYLGEIDFMELYMKNQFNQYSSWGTVKPKVILVDLNLLSDLEKMRLVLDARFVGNESRFIRKSCPVTANCEIRVVYITDLQVFKFLVVTNRPIVLTGEDLSEELRLEWEWDEAHPIRRMLRRNKDGELKEGVKFEEFEESEKAHLIAEVDTMLNFVECACNTSSIALQCSIFKVKKATSYLLRSTRKASNLSQGSGSTLSKEELVMPKRDKTYISWNQRLIDRDHNLHLEVFSVGKTSESSLDSSLAFDDVDEVPEVGPHSKKVVPSGGNIRTLKVPFKTQILVQGRRYASQKYQILNGLDAIDEDLDEETLAKRAIVPLTNEALSSIREAVANSYKSGDNEPKEISKILETPKVEVPNIEEVLKVDGAIEPNPTTVKVEISNEIRQPPVVKKLSFADYKKKKM